MHKLKNILDKLPKRLHGRAKLALKELVKAETREQAEAAVEQFDSDFGPLALGQGRHGLLKAAETRKKDSRILK